MGLTWRDFVRPGTSLAVTCSVFLALAAVMTSLVRFGVVGDTIPNVSNFNSTFDPSFLVAKWTWERSVFSWMLVADFCAAAVRRPQCRHDERESAFFHAFSRA